LERGPNDHIGPGAELDDGLGMTPEEKGRSEGEDRGYGLGYQDGRDSVRVLSVEAIARTCHAVNRTFSRSLGDESHEPWDDAPDWQRESAVKGVNYALDGVTDEELHAHWCDEKHRDGWVYGQSKDATAKTHPCLVPYDQLPPEQRTKDALFRTVVEALKPYLSS
jgi:hypothetical protein